jgi:hypothetical protein
MSDERPSNFAIDEFKALRDEIRRCESESLSTTLYTFTAVVLAAGLAEKSGLPKATIPILIQVALLWGMHRYHALESLRKRLSTYIQVMLEPELPGICWEGRNELFEGLYRKDHYFTGPQGKWYYHFTSPTTNRRLHLFSQVFFLLTLGSLYFSVDAVRKMDPHTIGFYAFILVLGALHLMSLLLMLNCVFLRRKEPFYKGIWQSIRQTKQ